MIAVSTYPTTIISFFPVFAVFKLSFRAYGKSEVTMVGGVNIMSCIGSEPQIRDPYE